MAEKITTFPILPETPIAGDPSFQPTGTTGFAKEFRGDIYSSRGRFGNGTNYIDIGATEMKSANFVSGSDGWRILYNGDVEFNEGVFRGAVTVGSISIGTSPLWFRADTSGNIWSGSADLATAQANTFAVTNAGALSCTSATILGATITTPTITSIQAGSEIAIQGWQTTLVFAASDYRTVGWSAGNDEVITLMDGTTYTFTAGNTSTMAALTYIYLDIATSTTALQVTTTAATAVGTGKILVAVAKNNPDTSANAEIQAFGGSATDTTILVDNMVANVNSTNEFISNTAQIKDAIINNAKIIDCSVGKLTAGTINSQAVVLGITATEGDCYIAGGTYDIAAWTATGGFILGIDDSDSDKEKFFIGDATTSLDWNVTTADTLTIKGTITATAGAIGGWTLSANAIYLDSGADATSSGMASADYPFYAGKEYASRATAPFRVTPAGALICTDATITGVITVSATSSGIASFSDAGALAVEDTADFDTLVSGAEKPADNATVGATAGTDLKDSGAATLEDYDVIKLLQSIYGDGADGTIDINSGTFTSGPITSNALTRDAFFINLTLSGGNLDTAGYRLFVRGILTINNGYKIFRDGNAGGNGGNGSGKTGGTAGAAAAALSSGSVFGSVAGIAGTVGAEGIDSNNPGAGSDAGGAGNAANHSITGAGAAGAQGGTGGTADGGAVAGGSGGTVGAAGAITTYYNKIRNVMSAYLLYDSLPTADNLRTASGAGGSSGGGSGGNDNVWAGSESGGGGGGGGGGSGGGIISIFARILVNNGDINSIGGAGGAGGDGAAGSTPGYPACSNGESAGGGGGGAGGSGGRGGVVVLVYNVKSGAGSVAVTGGAVGTGGTGGAGSTCTGGAAGDNGDNGTVGSVGDIIELEV